MVERPIKKSDLPPEEPPTKTERPERKDRKPRDRKDSREEKKSAIPPALLRGPKPQPKKEAPPEEAPETSEDSPPEEVAE